MIKTNLAELGERDPGVRVFSHTNCSPEFGDSTQLKTAHHVRLFHQKQKSNVIIINIKLAWGSLHPVPVWTTGLQLTRLHPSSSSIAINEPNNNYNKYLLVSYLLEFLQAAAGKAGIPDNDHSQ